MKRLVMAALLLGAAGCAGGEAGERASAPSKAAPGLVPPLNELNVVAPGQPLLTQTESDGASRQVLYRGVDGPGLFLGYRDSAGNAGDYNFDLRNGYVIRLGGARIAVVDVSDDGIHYRVLSGF